MEDLKSRYPNAKTTPSGLMYEVKKAGKNSMACKEFS